MPDSKTPSRWRDKPYAVGKGKPPVEYQFKPGQLPPAKSGRPKGSRNRTDLEKLLDEKVTVGGDSHGRPIRRRVGDVINRQLVKKAAEGDLSATKLILDFSLKMAALEHKRGPDAETLHKQRMGEEERVEAASHLKTKIIAMMELMANLNHLGAIDVLDDSILVRPWVREAAATRRSTTVDDQ